MIVQIKSHPSAKYPKNFLLSSFFIKINNNINTMKLKKISAKMNEVKKNYLKKIFIKKIKKLTL